MKEKFLAALLDQRMGIARHVWSGILSEAESSGFLFPIELSSQLDITDFKSLPCLGVIATVFNNPGVRLDKFPFPIINVSNTRGRIPGIGNILSDDHEVGCLAARYLITRGHRDLLGIGMPDRKFSSERMEGFWEVAGEAKVPVRLQEFDLWKTTRDLPSWSPEKRYRRTMEILSPWIDQLAPDGAIFTVDEWIARCVSYVLQNQFPERQATTGLMTVEGAAGSSFFPGPMGEITAVQPAFRKLGVEALRWMNAHGVQGCSAEDLLLRYPPLGVSERSSTAGPACRHPPTAQAIRMAWKQVKLGDPPRTRDLATFLRISVRTLDRQFVRETGKTAHDFLLDLRLNHAKQLLRHRPGWSVDRIASYCGFSKQSNFSLAFKKWAGTTPNAWRRQTSKTP